MEDRLLYRVPEVAVFLNISRSKVYELLGSGDLPSVKIDRSHPLGPRLRPAPIRRLASSGGLRADAACRKARGLTSTSAGGSRASICDAGEGVEVLLVAVQQRM